MKQRTHILILIVLLIAGCRAKDPQPSNSNSSNNNSSKAATTKSDDDEDQVIDEFNEECGCRALYNLIGADGGQDPASVAGNMVASSDGDETYPMIMKSPEKYYGAAVVISGRIIQISEQKVKDGYVTEVMVTLDRYQKKLVEAIGGIQTPFLEGDKVSIVGYLANHLYSYKSIAQWDMSVPLVIMRQMVKYSDAQKFRVPAPGGTKDMENEVDTYAKTFEQNVNIEALKSPDRNRTEMIQSSLDRVRAATDKNTAQYEKSQNHRLLSLTKLMRDGAEKKAAEMLAAAQ